MGIYLVGYEGKGKWGKREKGERQKLPVWERDGNGKTWALGRKEALPAVAVDRGRSEQGLSLFIYFFYVH